MENLKGKFIDYLSSITQYSTYLDGKDKCTAFISEIEFEYSNSFGTMLFDESKDRRVLINEVRRNLKIKGSSFKNYSNRRGSGVPNAILNTHYIQFLIGLKNENNRETPAQSLSQLLGVLVNRYFHLLQKAGGLEANYELYKWDLVTRQLNRPDVNAEDFAEQIKALKFSTATGGTLCHYMQGKHIRNLVEYREEQFKECLKKLFEEDIDLDDRVERFIDSCKTLWEQIKGNFPDNSTAQYDERLISCFLTLHNPQKYAFYKSDVYEKFCAYLDIQCCEARKKLSHFYELLNPLMAEVEKRQDLMDFVNQELEERHLIHSLPLLAQDILWQLAMGRLNKDMDVENTEDMNTDKYWHIQMHLPEGKDGREIDPVLMLREKYPVISTGEWDDSQCHNFKTIDNGNIVLVRKGSQAIALCEIIGENFFDDTLCKKYINTNFRRVKILAWVRDYKQPRSGLFSQGTFKPCSKGTEQYQYIEGWLQSLKSSAFVRKCTNLLKTKRNVILQGAPGTGKTYNTAAIALSVLGVTDVDLNDHGAVMKRYEELQDKSIFFTTFHQSLDYEDFVEGLKPEMQQDDNGKSIGVVYEPSDGIFKIACKAVESIDNENIVDCIDKYLQSIKGYQNRKMIPTVTGKSSLYVWWNEGNKTVSSRSVLSTSSKDEEYSPSPLNIEKIKLQALGDGRENNWTQYAQAFINAVKKEYTAKKDNPVVLIIDEINRGNVSKIFGELITLLESDKRRGGDHPVSVILPYSKETFNIPSNLFIIGTMNTTDRSTGTLDYALRRRFAFITLKSDVKVVEKFYEKLGDENLKQTAVALFNDIYDFIKKPEHVCGDLGIDDLMIGHSYFMAQSEEELSNKMEYEVLPLIAEYIKDGILNVKSEEKDNAFNAWLNLVSVDTVVTEGED